MATRRPRRRLRPRPHRRRLVGRGATGDQIAAVLRRAATRCTTSARSRTTSPRRRPATCCSRARSQGTARSVYTGLIRVAQGRPGHRRLPDQPQPQAQRRRLGRERAQPRDRDQRRPVQPRLHRRPDRRGAALLPREPRRAARGRPSGSIVLGFFDEVLEPAARRPSWSASCGPRSPRKLEPKRTLA